MLDFGSTGVTQREWIQRWRFYAHSIVSLSPQGLRPRHLPTHMAHRQGSDSLISKGSPWIEPWDLEWQTSPSAFLCATSRVLVKLTGVWSFWSCIPSAPDTSTNLKLKNPFTNSLCTLDVVAALNQMDVNAIWEHMKSLLDFSVFKMYPSLTTTYRVTSGKEKKGYHSDCQNQCLLTLVFLRSICRWLCYQPKNEERKKEIHEEKFRYWKCLWRLESKTYFISIFLRIYWGLVTVFFFFSFFFVVVVVV